MRMENIQIDVHTSHIHMVLKVRHSFAALHSKGLPEEFLRMLSSIQCTSHGFIWSTSIFIRACNNHSASVSGGLMLDAGPDFLFASSCGSRYNLHASKPLRCYRHSYRLYAYHRRGVEACTEQETG